MSKNQLLIFIIFNIIFFILSLQFNPLIYAPLILSGGFIAYKALEELYDLTFGTEFFLTIAIIMGIIGHEEWATTIILMIMLIAYYIEEVVKEKTDNSIETIINLIPSKAILKEGLSEKDVSIKDLKIGQIIVVKTGATIPVDGTVIEGNGLINNSSLTGESNLENKETGDKVFAATFVESGCIIVKVEKVGENTFFGNIKSLLEEAESNKPSILLSTDKIARYLVPVILLFILITWIITRDTSLAITLLVFGSPLDLVLIIPLTLLSSIIAGFKNGIIIKSGKSIENLAQTDTFMFDKTGTLTTGELKILSIESLSKEYSKEDILKIAAIAEKRSLHPIANAIISQAKKDNIIIPDPQEYQNIPEGVLIKHNNIEYKIGNFKNKINKQNTEFDILADNICIGRIFLEDKIKNNARQVISKLHSFDIPVFLLTGDNEFSTKEIEEFIPTDKNLYKFTSRSKTRDN